MKIKRFEFNMFPVNCYVIWDETKEAAVIDAGSFWPKEHKTLKDFITDLGLTLKHVLNTHLHLDHVFGNAALFREFGLKPEANVKDEEQLDLAPRMCQLFGFEINETPQPIGKGLVDGDVVTFGNTRLEVIEVPGHSPGGLVFYCKEDSLLFSGDSLFNGSIGRTDLKGGDFYTLRESVQRRILTLPDDTVVYPGHGETTTIGNEKMYNPFFR